MDYFSGHADQNELMDYLSLNSNKRLKNIYLVHGDEDQALPLKSKILQKGYKNVDFPLSGENFVI